MFEEKTIKSRGVSTKIYSLNGMVKIALLSAIATLLMFVAVPIPIFPSFLKVDLGDLPALIGGFALGPVAGMAIEFIKNLLDFMFGSATGGVGHLSNFIVGTSFVVPASLIYKKNKTKKSAVIGMAVGTISMVILSCISNYYIIIPLYTKLFSMEAVMGLMKEANEKITDIKTYIIYAVIPFNFIKASIISIICLIIYKKVSPILHK